jgi:hypothetical protein
MVSDKPLSLWGVLFFVAAGLLILVLGWRLVSAVKRFLLGRDDGFWTVYEWEHALLYVNGRFSRLLPPGRHFSVALGRTFDLHKLRKHDQLLATSPWT